MYRCTLADNIAIERTDMCETKLFANDFCGQLSFII